MKSAHPEGQASGGTELEGDEDDVEDSMDYLCEGLAEGIQPVIPDDAEHGCRNPSEELVSDSAGSRRPSIITHPAIVRHDRPSSPSLPSSLIPTSSSAASPSDPIRYDVYGPRPYAERKRVFEVPASRNVRQAHWCSFGVNSLSRIRSATHTAYVIRQTPTGRAKRKAHEKEIPWGQMPAKDQEAYRQALAKQCDEYLKWEAVEPLSVKLSEQLRATVPADHLITSRVAYRDKNVALRTPQNPVPLAAKARLIIGEHKEPRLAQGLRTDAPTVSRLGVYILLQLCASFNFCIDSADIEAAFLQGKDRPNLSGSDLYLQQPREGWPGLDPRQLLWICKGVSGFADSPRLWWNTFAKAVLSIEAIDELDGTTLRFNQSSLDPALFICHDSSGQLVGILGVHVDDLLTGVDPRRKALRHAVHNLFPCGSLRHESFEYCGKTLRTIRDSQGRIQEIRGGQRSFIEGRLDPVACRTGKDLLEEKASYAEAYDNRSGVGGLSWLSSQTRPDLTFGVSRAQSAQADPTLHDIAHTNRLIRLAKQTTGFELTIRPI